MVTNLDAAVAKTMNLVFADIEISTNEVKKRINVLKANIGKVANIPIEEIKTNENVRKSIDTKSESFSRLVESIKKYGILENIVVELRFNKQETDYQLVCIAGHRRILAAKAAKSITKIPCLLQSFAQKGDCVGAALAENLNREDLHCIDVAEGYAELVNAGWTEDDLANHFCRDIRTVRHYLKMAFWSDEIKQILRQNPSIFSTRVIMRQFAYKKFGSLGELKSAIKNLLAPKETKKNPLKSNSSSLASTTNLDKKSIKTALDSYLSKQKLLSGIIKDEIKRAFIELKLI
jgi:ParB/RepB/Spo0J family partition protein